MQIDKNIQLNPIIEADPVAFSFDTIGWKILFFLLVLTFLFLIYKYYLHYKKNQYRRDAIQNINELSMDHDISICELITHLMFQLKQTALQTYDRKLIASLEGVNWLQFLDDKVKGTSFIKNQKIIKSAVYENKFEQTAHFNRDNFINMSIKWIKEHA